MHKNSLTWRLFLIFLLTGKSIPLFAQDSSHQTHTFQEWVLQVAFQTHPFIQKEDTLNDPALNYPSWGEPRLGYRWNRLTLLFSLDYQGASQSNEVQGTFTSGILKFGIGTKIHFNQLESVKTSYFDPFLSLYVSKPLLIQNTDDLPSNTMQSPSDTRDETGLGFQVGLGGLYRIHSHFSFGVEVGYSGYRWGFVSNIDRLKSVVYLHQLYTRFLFEVQF